MSFGLESVNAQSKNKIDENSVDIENSSSCALVLHMTSNLIISRRSQDKNGKEMYQNVKRTCRACKAIVLPY